MISLDNLKITIYRDSYFQVCRPSARPSAGFYAKYEVDNPYHTAGTREFTLQVLTGSLFIAGLLLKSSTTNSTKKFKIIVSDDGTLSAVAQS